MRKLIMVLSLVFISTFLVGQSKEGLKKIESARIALITERLELTPEQAEKFWPLYREYSEKRKALRQEFVEARQSVDRKNMTEEESKMLLNKGLELKERQLNIDRTYAERLTRVISTQQLLQLRKAEDDFRRMLLERLERRRDQRDRINSRQERRDNDF
ncbi:hypothetical protein JMN32_11815 [Fulvivirga sp. 29W222]|uniref:Sensor of ECF-type sigma factor n=1 Tax=Fulvivirga marina TaxID=2494733 RepID=A0A937FZ23_9BACT|nr:hypothetical protein [Fulvivirga marina]MBL6447000.1 hypothetical protein [Fulvivirga marina]